MRPARESVFVLLGTPFVKPVSHAGGLIAFVKFIGKKDFYLSGDSYICVVRPDGTGLRRLTHHLDLVLLAAGGQGADQVIVPKEEAENGRLRNGVFGESSWSSDGRMIAFGMREMPFAWPGPLHVVRSDGWGVRTVPHVIGWDPAVRPEWQERRR